MPPDYIDRVRLSEMLEAGPGGGLTLLSTPAGCGKTTLVSAWLAATGRPSAWLTLVRRERDLATFGTELVAAIQQLAPNVAFATSRLLSQGVFTPIHSLAETLAWDLARLPDRTVVVLDDYHRVEDESAHALLSELLTRLPPTVRLVVVTRRDPPLSVSLLRSHGRLTEVTARDLRFRSDEVRALLGRAVPLPVPESTAAAIEERSEGWAAGLRLLSLALSSHPDASAWTDDLLRGDHPYPRTFLLDEILNTQSVELQDLLTRTAISQRFCVDLCDALLPEGTPPGRSQILIDDLAHVQRLLYQLDDHRQWFRHHRLLREALREHGVIRFGRNGIADLHRRAGDWFAAQGLHDEALEHTLASGDEIRAADRVEQSVHAAFDGGDWPALRRWLGMLPPALVEQRPRLMLASAWLMNFKFRFAAIPPVVDQIEALLDRNERGLPDNDIQALRGECNLLRALVCMTHGDGRQTLDLAEQAYQALPRRAGYVYAVAMQLIGLGYHLLGETPAATTFLETCIEIADGGALGTQHALWALTMIHIASGDFWAADHTARRLLAVSPADRPLSLSWACYVLGVICYELHELAEARERFLAVDQLRDMAHVVAARNSILGLALTEHALGKSDMAFDVLDRLTAFSDQSLGGQQQGVIHVFRAWLAFRDGDRLMAESRLRTAGADIPMSLEHLAGSPRLVRVKLLIAVGNANDLAEASRTLDALEAAYTSVNNTLSQIAVQAVRGLLFQAQGDHVAALASIGQAVERARPGGLVRTFVDLGPAMYQLLVEFHQRTGRNMPYLEHLLAAFPEGSAQLPPASAAPDHPPGASAQIVALTWREQEILRLLDARRSNKEIARVLHIAPETVKKHARSIYRKLAVRNRREAIIQGRAIGLLGEADAQSAP